MDIINISEQARKAYNKKACGRVINNGTVKLPEEALQAIREESLTMTLVDERKDSSGALDLFKELLQEWRVVLPTSLAILVGAWCFMWAFLFIAKVTVG